MILLDVNVFEHEQKQNRTTFLCPLWSTLTPALRVCVWVCVANWVNQLVTKWKQTALCTFTCAALSKHLNPIWISFTHLLTTNLHFVLIFEELLKVWCCFYFHFHYLGARKLNLTAYVLLRCCWEDCFYKNKPRYFFLNILDTFQHVCRK